MSGTSWLSSIALLFLALAACDRAEPPPGEWEPLVEFEAAPLRITTKADTFRLRAEIAETDEQRQHGLMERPSLAEDAGMIFLYPEPQDTASGFWMYRTLVPLDIAFLDEEGRIAAIRSMEPCPETDPRWCPVYTAGVPYSAALEVNRGYFAARGIGVGDRVALLRPEDPFPAASP